MWKIQFKVSAVCVLFKTTYLLRYKITRYYSSAQPRKRSVQSAIIRKLFDVVMRDFYILLTVHLVMILGKWPTSRTVLSYVFISILYMFRATSCSSSGESNVSIQHLVYVTLCRWPFRVQVGPVHETVTDTEWRTPDVVLIQLILWWWARGCSKDVEDWNKHIGKNCASSWSFTKNQ